MSDPSLAPVAIPQSASGGPAPVTASLMSSPDIVVMKGSQAVDVNTATATYPSCRPASGPGRS